MKTALEENNSYTGSHIDHCYQCVLRFSNGSMQDLGENETLALQGSDLYTTSYHSLNGKRIYYSNI